jgi:hypothetical protein
MIFSVTPDDDDDDDNNDDDDDNDVFSLVKITTCG